LLIIVLLAAAGGACGGHPPGPEQPPPPDAGPSFIADQADFDNFTTWLAFDGGSQADALDSLDGGQRVIYLNQAPPPGSLHFPLGTVIVKTTEGATTFAMVKRGGGFNADLPGWEFFGLAPSLNGRSIILWRGVGTVGTLAYGSMPATGCDACHLGAYQNDFVWGGPQLSVF
jgi:hypothetical protein